MAEVELTTEGPVAVVTLNRPDKRNAISMDMQRELIAVLERVAANRELRALMITGAGGDFCVGGDRAVIARMDAEQGFEAEAAAQHRVVIGQLFALEIPLIAAIEGAAFGFGAELAACCDVVLMGETARLADPHVRFGLAPAPVLLLVWPQLISRLAAAELLMTGREVPAPEAVSLGLASRVVPAGRAYAEARALADTIAALPAGGIVTAKRALRLELVELDRFYPPALTKSAG